MYSYLEIVSDLDLLSDFRDEIYDADRAIQECGSRDDLDKLSEHYQECVTKFHDLKESLARKWATKSDDLTDCY